MRRVMIFLGLKIAEIVGVAIGWTGFCFVGRFYEEFLFRTPPEKWIPFWWSGLPGIAITGFVVFVLFMIGLWIKSNWDWSDNF